MSLSSCPPPSDPSASLQPPPTAPSLVGSGAAAATAPPVLDPNYPSTIPFQLRNPTLSGAGKRAMIRPVMYTRKAM